MSSGFKRTTAAGVEVFVRRGNADHRILMLHGIGSNHASFDLLADQLPQGFELLAWNAPGYGESQPLASAEPTAEHYADKLHAVVEELGLKRFTLLGHSLGTLIATEFARRFPDSVEAVILLSCAQGYSMNIGSTLPEKSQQRLTDLDSKGLLAFAQERAPRLLHNPDSKPQLVKAAIEAMSQINPAGYRQAVYMLAAGNLKQTATAVQTNSLTLVASADVITPMQQSRDCHDALCAADANAKHVYAEIPNAGHLVHQEEPAEVARHIVEFAGWDANSTRELTA